MMCPACPQTPAPAVSTHLALSRRLTPAGSRSVERLYLRLTAAFSPEEKDILLGRVRTLPPVDDSPPQAANGTAADPSVAAHRAPSRRRSAQRISMVDFGAVSVRNKAALQRARQARPKAKPELQISTTLSPQAQSATCASPRSLSVSQEMNNKI